MTPDIRHGLGPMAASREMTRIEEALKRREKQLPVLPIFLVLALATSLYHMIIGF